MYPEESKPFVLTIHGIRTKGEWQELIEPLLRPFYRHRGFKYDEYEHSIFSVIWLALQIFGGLAGLAVVWLILQRWHPFGSWLDWLFAALVLTSFWLGFGILATNRLDKVTGKFAKFWGETVGFRSAPHVIAHSLGTFITGTCLTKHQGLRAESIVLNGCVLHRSFRWGDIRDDSRIREVRNEIARKDWVSWIAYLLHGSVPQMGHAGVFGFHEPPHTYTWDDPHRVLWYCGDSCTCFKLGVPPNESLRAFVHNIVHSELGHSDMHLGPAHAIAFWLPALWGIPSLPYVKFRELCIACNDAEKKHAPNGSELERKLRTTCWGWTEGTLEQRVQKQVQFRLSGIEKTLFNQTDINHTVSLSIRNLWTAVATAVEQQEDEKWAVNLHPQLALLNSVEASLVACGLLADGNAATT